MNPAITNIDDAKFEECVARDGKFWSLDLSGDHLGVHIEELPPKSTSSFHHFHTLEEEHVIVLAGAATLHLGSQTFAIKMGDHLCFKAGVAEAHHIENSSEENFKFLVFGERREGDVVFYPNGPGMLVKALGKQQYTYAPRTKPEDAGD